MTTQEPTHVAAPGYALGRLARALETAATHEDPAVRERARDKVDQWRAVLDGMRRGVLTVGSRTPVDGTPAWVTLEVVHGGFATGRYIAEGALQTHEEELLPLLPDTVPGETPRERLNLYFASDEGQRQLVEAIESGTYRIAVPEEGALPVIAWLVHRGRTSEAFELIEVLRPLMHRLRFYPRLEAQPRPADTMVRVATVGEVSDKLASVRPQAQVVAMNETYTVWNPLYDRLVALWLDTVQGEPPTLARDDGGALRRSVDGQPIVEGGWPCKRWPSDWTERRELWLAEYTAARREHRLGRKHSNPKSNFAVLAGALEKCPTDSARLLGREVGAIRHSLAGTVARHGAPGSSRRDTLRAEQARVAGLPLHADIAAIVVERLKAYPEDGGLASVEPLGEPVRGGEGDSVAVGTTIPAQLIAKAERALEAPVAELVERGIIGSAEVLAIVLPQITAQVAAGGIDDAPLRDLYAQIYAAFRRRRSLLLLDLEHQVRIEELPWIAALEPLRRPTVGAQDSARLTLEEVTRLTIAAFPHTIIPNPLVREMAALAQRAGAKLPLVEEVAADIFMGTFTAKWSKAAAVARDMLAGSLYARYYDLPELPPPREHKTRWGKTTDEAFAVACKRRAAEAGTGGSFVAANGAILEQSQILTTQNLAVLVVRLHLEPDVRRLAPALARQVLDWVVTRQVQVAPDFRARLRMLKNTAYAWRQAIFLLSLCEEHVQLQAVRDLKAAVAEQSPAYQARFDPVVRGLELVVRGGRFDTNGHGEGGARRFLGWSCGHHWLMPG